MDGLFPGGGGGGGQRVLRPPLNHLPPPPPRPLLPTPMMLSEVREKISTKRQCIFQIHSDVLSSRKDKFLV